MQLQLTSTVSLVISECPSVHQYRLRVTRYENAVRIHQYRPGGVAARAVAVNAAVTTAAAAAAGGGLQ